MDAVAALPRAPVTREELSAGVETGGRCGGLVAVPGAGLSFRAEAREMGKRHIGNDGELDDDVAVTGAAMCLVSASFADGEALPVAHTGDGGYLSPPLAWDDVPRAGRSLVLLFEGPDPAGRAGAPPFAHWI